MNRGLIVGKFYPLHAGHHYLIETALKECDEVFVLLLWSKRESISYGQRLRWLQKHHPEIYVLSQQDEIPPNYKNPDVWDMHMRIINEVCPVGHYKYVFHSEEYGDELARRMNAKSYAVDIPRSTFPISGSEMRNDLGRNWRYLLSRDARAELCRRVAIVGSESTGTTTLSQSLAKYFETAWVPEYGRTFTQAAPKRHVWTEEDFVVIANEQQRQEDIMARRSGPVLICDTDALATGVWHERYLGSRSQAVRDIAASRSYDYYFITNFEGVPWEDDGTRDGPNDRKWMHKRFIEEVSRSKIPYKVLTGDKEKVFHIAKDLIENNIMKWYFNDPLG